MRKVLKNKVVKYAVTAAMVMSVMMTTACNSKIKVDYGYNPTDYVELGDYKGIQAEVDVTAITNQVIDDKIAEQLESETTYTDVNREAQKGDKVTFGYTGTSGGLSIDDFTGSDYSMTLGKDAFPVAGTGLDEELYGMEKVKQRIIETIIQINRTHTLPAYGLLIVGPAGTGKSQVAYAVAKILKLSFTTLDMSSINDPEQLTGSSRVYANAKPGIIMEAFAQAGESKLVFIINELDKANEGKGNGNPADVLLTLLDNLGFTDNYMECMIPTDGVYPIATANDKSKISAPIMSRFAVIEIPDYTPDEKKIIFTKYALPKILKRMGMSNDEISVTDDGLDAIVKLCSQTSGIRDVEQVAEHLAAHALYQIEVNHVTNVTFNAEMIRRLIE